MNFPTPAKLTTPIIADSEDPAIWQLLIENQRLQELVNAVRSQQNQFYARMVEKFGLAAVVDYGPPTKTP